MPAVSQKLTSLTQAGKLNASSTAASKAKSVIEKKKYCTLGEVENTGGNSLANNQKAGALLFLLLLRSQNTRASSLSPVRTHKKKCLREEKPP